MTHRVAILMFALLLLADDACADVRLPGQFSDHMVLQREMPVRVWGFADPGERVTVKLAGRSASTKADGDGRWRVELPALDAGGPHKLSVRATNKITIKDVLVGEVWLCTGQSNMEWTVQGSANARKEIAAAKDKQIRHLKVPHRASGSPEEDIAATWTVCSPKTAGQYTACGYFMARRLRKQLRVPIGLINVSWGGTRIEPWIAPAGFAGIASLEGLAEGVAAAAGKQPRSHQQTSVLYNGMLHPLVGYPLRGAIWYQGESNHREGASYTAKQVALIGGWRKLWDCGPMPFHFVQIAPFRYGKEASGILPVFWEAQAAVLEQVPDTGMVVTTDVATRNNIHPPNKQDVGERLALLALRRTYGKDVVDSGPAFRSMAIEGSTLRVTFENARGLRARDRRPLTHFEIAGADSGYVAADARIDGESIVLSAKGVAAPLAMRFAWHKLAEPNLVNGARLPAVPFRAGKIPAPDFLGGITEAQGYTLVYDLDLEKLSGNPTYDVDAHAALEGGFESVAYLLELKPHSGPAQFLWVSLDAFTDDPRRIAIPTAASEANFQMPAANLTIRSNVAGVPTGAGRIGNIEFWPNNYAPPNADEVAGASSKIYDHGDQPAAPVDGYGSMQLHDSETRSTLFAINRWKSGGAGADIGIGTSTLSERSTDWTFAGNGGSYLHKRLRVFVRSSKPVRDR